MRRRGGVEYFVRLELGWFDGEIGGKILVKRVILQVADNAPNKVAAA